MSFDRNFGIEMEFNGLSREQSIAALTNAGISARIEGYNHNDHHDGTWKIVSDASVRNGHEVVSPILHGNEGLKVAIRAAIALEKAGATIDRTCGLHVHFNAADLSVDELRTICIRYANHEESIDEMMPASRRGNVNQYCRSVKDCFLRNTEFNRASTPEELAHAQGSRYYKVNLQAYLRHHTIEFRQHSGTVDSSKIAYWVLFLNSFINESIRIAHAGTAPAARELPRLEGREQSLVAMLRNGALDARSIAETFGIQIHSVATIVFNARKHGIEISTRRRAGCYTVYELANQAENTHDAITSFAGDELFHGVDDGIRAFYEIRAMQLAA